MIEVFSNPLLLDFLRICLELPPDERQHIERISGEPFTEDACAVSAFSIPGPKWVVKKDGVPLAAGGFVMKRPGVWRDYLLTTPQAWEPPTAFRVTLACRRIMNAMFESGEAHRVECLVPEIRVKARPELDRWYKAMRYSLEATLQGYCADGTAACVYSRVGA